MEINYLLITFAILMLICIIRGATRGMLRIVFGLLAWIFLICMVNFGSEYLSGYLSTNTELTTVFQDNLNTHLHERYNASEEKEAGTGEDSIMGIVPPAIKDKVEESVQSSIDATINVISQELTNAAIKGISTIACFAAGVIVIFLLDKLIKLIGFVPGVRDVNRLLGMLAGFAEGMLFIWLIMFIADCFPASAFGTFIIGNIENDQMLYFIYQNNIIERIIGI